MIRYEIRHEKHAPCKLVYVAEIEGTDFVVVLGYGTYTQCQKWMKELEAEDNA